ncbi:MAG TPA: YerC/YecD family TrpR-related protein [Candidatus Paceibacterota bacterium]|nr:YerC/YecD family TrpR-related protein [Candidatus Paceibacterota bacterium]
MEKWNTKTTEELAQAISALRSKQEAKKFLRDLLTPQEIMEFSRRWQAARMLSESIPYSQIEKETGLSSTTVARVSRWLNKGMGGYKLMIDRLAKTHHGQTLVRRG